MVTFVILIVLSFVLIRLTFLNINLGLYLTVSIKFIKFIVIYNFLVI